MKVDVVNTDNKKVGSLELNDDVFGGRVNDALIWESVVHTNASARRGTHKTKNRANVAAAAASRGSRRAPAARASAVSGTRCGAMAARCSALSHAATASVCRPR
jgi:large subunit ribosomal protein L4